MIKKINELFYKTKAEISIIIKNRLNEEFENLLENFEKDLKENKIVEKFLDLGIDEFLLKKYFYVYFWNEYYLEKNSENNNNKYFYNLSLSNKLSHIFLSYKHNYDKTPYYVAREIYSDFHDGTNNAISEIKEFERFNELSILKKLLEKIKLNKLTKKQLSK